MKDIREFILSPSPSQASQDLYKIVNRVNNKQEALFLSKNLVTQFQKELKIQLYLKKQYLDYYQHLKLFEFKNNSLQNLIKYFEEEFTKLIFNNFVLADIYAREKNKKTLKSQILTEEESRQIYLRNYYHQKINYKKFINKFGYLALDPYELKNPRFYEYNRKKLLKVAWLCKDIDFGNKISLEEYLKNTNIADYSILIALREKAKSKILLVVSNIRQNCLDLEKEHKITDIFDLSINKILKLEK